jgi:hypothetical protein
MSSVKHLSMRIPWRDRPWDQFLCDDPKGNSSCTLLAAIGKGRDDEFEAEHAGAPVGSLDHDRLPCLSERATFMSPVGYTVVKEHPYSHNQALRGSLLPTSLSVPGHAFEAIPFRWLNRASLNDEIGHARVPAFDQLAEDHTDQVLNSHAAWVMDGGNQQAVIKAFFEPVAPRDSLVFVYLKHSPLQEQHRPPPGGRRTRDGPDPAAAVEPGREAAVRLLHVGDHRPALPAPRHDRGRSAALPAARAAPGRGHRHRRGTGLGARGP